MASNPAMAWLDARFAAHQAKLQEEDPRLVAHLVAVEEAALEELTKEPGVHSLGFAMFSIEIREGPKRAWEHLCEEIKEAERRKNKTGNSSSEGIHVAPQ